MNDIEPIYKILFLIFSLMWSGNILLFRSERQVIINPIIIIIASVLVFLPSTNEIIFGMEVDEMKSTLYIAYYLIVIWGLIITRRKTDLF